MKFICLILGCLLVYSSVDATNSLETIFTDHYLNRFWKGDSSSGPGSGLDQTELLRQELPKLLQKYGCQTLVDAPCGDFYWMQHVDLPVSKYIGIDIVAPIIEANRRLFESKERTFLHLDITKQVVPRADIILCRDALIHLSYSDIFKTIRLFKRSKSTYLLTTSFTSRSSNYNIPSGEWHPINLTKPPFNFPPPLEILVEGCTEENHVFFDKSLLLWRLEDL